MTTRHSTGDEERCRCIDCLIARSSIGHALADIRARGIDAHLRGIELTARPRNRGGNRR